MWMELLRSLLFPGLVEEVGDAGDDEAEGGDDGSAHPGVGGKAGGIHGQVGKEGVHEWHVGGVGLFVQL